MSKLHRFTGTLPLSLGLAFAMAAPLVLALAAPQAAPTTAAVQPPAPTRAGAATPRARVTRVAEDRDEDAPKGTDVLAPGLDKLLQGSGDADSFWIDVTWPTSANLLTAVRVFGNGVGTWNRAVQFRLTPEDVRSILEELREVHFGAYPIDVREKEERNQKHERDETELYGRIIVRLGDVTHVVRQMGDKPERELEALAKKVLELSRQPAARGEKVGNLDDGLARLAGGTIAPEVLEVLARRKVDKPDPGAGQENWMLRINGSRAVDRDLTRQPAVERELRLSDPELKTLISLLRDARVGSLPQSLWAPRYSTLRVQVLNQMRNIQARQFVGMTAETHGAQQKAFDKVFAWCEKTHQRVLAKGRVVPPQRQERESEKEREKEKEKD